MNAPSYFIECLLYNVPDGLFAPKLAQTYAGIVGWLKNANLQDFQCQNGRAPLFGPGPRTMVSEESKGVRQGNAGAVGGGRLRRTVCP